MRLWEGREMEGPKKGKYTLFVEADVITIREATIIFNKLRKKYFNAKYFGTGRFNAIYFGAGRIDLKQFDGEAADLIFWFCNYSAMDITYEISTVNSSYIIPLLRLLQSTDAMIVWRIDIAAEQAFKNSYIKFDNDKTVVISAVNPKYTTSLTDLKKGLYEKVDKLIYDDTEKEN